MLLTDFGIAKAPTAGDDLTSDNIMMGTAKYLSPEQVRGRQLDGRADLYSLGLVLYECLAGRVPFLGETDADTALARLNRDPTPPSSLRPSLPPALNDLLRSTLARDPSERPASVADFRGTNSCAPSFPVPAPARLQPHATDRARRQRTVTRRPHGGDEPDHTATSPRPAPRTVTFTPCRRRGRP